MFRPLRSQGELERQPFSGLAEGAGCDRGSRKHVSFQTNCSISFLANCFTNTYYCFNVCLIISLLVKPAGRRYMHICTFSSWQGFARRAGPARACVPRISGNTFCIAVLFAGVALAYSSICFSAQVCINLLFPFDANA